MTPVHRLATLATATALLLAAGCSGGDGGTSAGDVVAAGSGHSAGGSPVSITVPTGSLSVTVGDPVSSVSGDQTSSGKKVAAPDGGSLVPVSWSVADLGSTPWGGVLARPAKPATVWLVDGDHSYRVGSPYSTNGSALAESPQTAFYVAVGDKPSPDDLAVKVEYDGGAQVASAATGRPAAGSPSLADLSADQPGGVACPSKGWHASDPKLDLKLDCQIRTVGQSDYYPGVGWAPAGQTFEVVNVPEVRLLDAVDDSGGGSTTYKVAGIIDHSTLGTSRSATALHQAAPPQEYVAGGTLVFRTDPGKTDPLRLALTFELQADDVRGNSAAPARRKVTISRTVPLR